MPQVVGRDRGGVVARAKVAVPRRTDDRNAVRPYRAAFGSRFATLLAYRGAALTGVSTQCWWGGIKIMILCAFYPGATAAAAAPISLTNAITYTWVG
jgi:ABC-2 type transport system permease protein